jgi:hypothetical protein
MEIQMQLRSPLGIRFQIPDTQFDNFSLVIDFLEQHLLMELGVIDALKRAVAFAMASAVVNASESIQMGLHSCLQ